MSSISKIFLIAIALFSALSSQAKFDSLRIEKINGKKFIVHRVDPKETLYSISKRYGSTIDEIYEYNESIENGLQMYFELLIPYSKRKKIKQVKVAPTNSSKDIHVVVQGETIYGISKKHNIPIDSLQSLNGLSSGIISIGDTLILSKPNKPKKEIVNITRPSADTFKYHKVAPSETLFAISKMYDVSIDQLTTWNNLESYNLEIGQELIVGQTDLKQLTIEVPKTSLPTDSIAKKPPIDTTYVRTDTTVFKKQTVERDGKIDVIEEGFAMRIEDTDFTTKLLALHKTAPMGSLVKVKNQMTNIEIEVRVVGSLPNSGLNRNVLLRLSGAAYKELGGLDLKIPITSTYVKD